MYPGSDDTVEVDIDADSTVSSYISNFFILLNHYQGCKVNTDFTIVGNC